MRQQGAPHMRPAIYNFLALLLGFSCFADSSSRNEEFRTPVRRYGSAYSIKLTLKRDMIEYTVPVWIRPDQAASSLDVSLLKDMGWNYKDLRADEVLLSRENIDQHEFKSAKSDWVFPPEYPKVCCYGVIGQDILKHFQLRFDPQAPANIQWTRIIYRGEKISPTMNQDLSRLFSLHQEKHRFGKRFDNKEIDFSETPYVLNLSKEKLVFETPRVIPLKKKLTVRKTPIFSFTFIPPDRDARVETVASDVAKSAAAAGLRKGLSLIYLDGLVAGTLDRHELADALTGKVSPEIELMFEVSPRTMKKDAVRRRMSFDFAKNEFTPLATPTPVPTATPAPTKPQIRP